MQERVCGCLEGQKAVREKGGVAARSSCDLDPVCPCFPSWGRSALNCGDVLWSPLVPPGLPPGAFWITNVFKCLTKIFFTF